MAGVRKRPGGELIHGRAGDFDGDGYPDLFVANQDGPCRLFRNNRDGTFTDVAPQLGVTRPRFAFSC